MSGTKASIIIIIFLAVIVFLASVFTVPQSHVAIVLNLGKVVQDAKTNKAKLYQPGLHFKIPLIETVKYMDLRLQSLEYDASRIKTSQQKDVLVDYYVKWEIVNPLLFYNRTTNNISTAQGLLIPQLNDRLSAEFGKRTISQVVSTDRVAIMQSLRHQANISAVNLGIKVVDVRIKGIDLPRAVSNAVFARMKTERERVATEHREMGKAKAAGTRTRGKAHATIIVAEAKAKAAKIRAEGIQEAAKIFAKAYNKNPKFYAFYRSIEAYENVFTNKNDLLVLRPDSQFFRYFGSALGGQKTEKH